MSFRTQKIALSLVRGNGSYCTSVVPNCHHPNATIYCGTLNASENVTDNLCVAGKGLRQGKYQIVTSESTPPFRLLQMVSEHYTLHNALEEVYSVFPHLFRLQRVQQIQH